MNTKSKLDLTAVVLDAAGNELPNTQLTLSLVSDQVRGGHQHPLAAGQVIARLGVITPSRCTTGINAHLCNVTITTNNIAGELKIQATTSNGQVFQVPVVIAVSANGGNDFEQMGATSSAVMIGDTPSHPLNHFGRPGFLTNVRQFAQDYAARWGAPACVNDISLIRGGIFDLNSNFGPPHAEHRNGDTGDIRSNNTIVRGSYPNCLGTLVTPEALLWIRDELFALFGHNDHTREDPGSPNEHWHVRATSRPGQ